MSTLQIRETSVGPWKAKEKQFLCPHCHGRMYVKIPWRATALKHHQLVSEAIGEHRRLCAAAPPEASRVYQVTYPRG